MVRHVPSMPESLIWPRVWMATALSASVKLIKSSAATQEWTVWNESASTSSSRVRRPSFDFMMSACPLQDVIVSEWVLPGPIGGSSRCASKLRQCECKECRSCSDRNVLFSVDRERYRSGINSGATLEMPQSFPCCGIQRDEISFGVSRENQSSRGRKYARPTR